MAVLVAMAVPSLPPDILRKDNEDPEREPSLSGYMNRNSHFRKHRPSTQTLYMLYLHLYSSFRAIDRWQIHHRIVLEIMMSQSLADYNPSQQGLLLDAIIISMNPIQKQ